MNNVKELLKNLMTFEPMLQTEAIVDAFKLEPEWVEKQDVPFLSEAYLYPLLGKDDARTILSYFRKLIMACGYDEMELEREINSEKYKTSPY